MVKKAISYVIKEAKKEPHYHFEWIIRLKQGKIWDWPPQPGGKKLVMRLTGLSYQKAC